MTNKNTICLWFDGSAVDAATFYAETFPDSAVGKVFRAPSDYPDGNQGDVLTVEFTVVGIPCIGLNGGPQFKHSEAFLFKSQPITKLKPTVCGTLLSAMVVKKANAAGAKTDGDCHGRLPRARLQRRYQTLIKQRPSGRLMQ